MREIARVQLPLLDVYYNYHIVRLSIILESMTTRFPPRRPVLAKLLLPGAIAALFLSGLLPAHGESSGPEIRPQSVTNSGSPSQVASMSHLFVEFDTNVHGWRNSGPGPAFLPLSGMLIAVLCGNYLLLRNSPKASR